MPPVAIKFDRVSKEYRLRRSLSRAGKLHDSTDDSKFFALKDVSFEIKRGETVGLIGPNGAGKSTILKILSRVTVPSRGSFTVRGRLGALIEVGAGFHPELTGREIDAKFDQIVAFSEVLEKFLDTPLKFYSAGMMVRLGFAVAAHIEPENLLVDEVLAVGDTAFQAKCLNKIAELKEQDKTIVLVSHAMPSILQHSSRVLWIDHGTIQAFGDPEETVESYLRTVHSHGTSAVADDPTVITDSPIKITEVTVLNANGESHGSLAYGEPAYVDIAYTVMSPIEDPVVSLTFQDVKDFPLGGVTSRFDGIRLNGAGGTNKIRLVLAPVLFTRGSYGVTVAIQDQRIQRYLDMRPRAATFMVDGPSVASREVSGHFVFPHRWELGPGED